MVLASTSLISIGAEAFVINNSSSGISALTISGLTSVLCSYISTSFLVSFSKDLFLVSKYSFCTAKISPSIASCVCK